MKKDILKVGILGLGKIAQIKYLPALKKDKRCRIIALCDHSQELLTSLGKDYGIKPDECYTDLEEFLQSDMDIVFILNHDHKKIMEAAIAQNKHIFVEKPVCWDEKSVEQILKLAKTRNLMIYSGYMKLFDPAYLFFKKEIQKNSKQPICMRAKCYAGNVKQWADPLYNIRKESIQEKDISKQILQDCWEKWFMKNGFASESQKTLAKTLLQLGIHNLNLMQDLMGKPLTIKNCYSDAVRSTYFKANLEIGETVPCDYVLFPCFQAPWEWKESYEAVYEDKTIQLSFGNPFLPVGRSKVRIESIQDGKYVKQDYKFDQTDSFVLQLDDCIKRFLSKNWDYQNMNLVLNDLHLIEEILESVEFYGR